MENIEVIDLFGAPFWITVAVACVVMIPLVGGSARRLAFAAINLGFLWYFLRAELLAVLAGVLLVHLALRFVYLGRLSGVWLTAGGAAALALFMVHKLPASYERNGLHQWNHVMTLIGYSYVVLRLVEVVRAIADRRHPVPSLIALFNYLLPFHMLSAGPIQSYDEFVGQPDSPPAPRPAETLRACERIAAGMFKKFVLANALKTAFLTSFRAEAPYFFLEVQINYIWLFLDFSAYSDIAVGIGSLIGVATPENFDRPFLARNLIDFWERWHMSFSQWIRRNLFIPTQLALVRRTGGKYPLLIASFAFALTFVLCGLWHRLNLNGLTFGAYHGFGLIICNLYRDYLLRTLGRKGLKQYLANPWIRVAATVLTFEYVAFALVILTYPWSLFDLVGSAMP
jgi:D-alanyl-lipoteichoic acid acyltransferase DltB (MBOAT superfamily)